MTTHREGIFVDKLWVEKEPLSNRPSVQEVGLTSAPLESMSLFFNQFCSKFSTEFMTCKSKSKDPNDCLLEGRKVTRCALDLISKLKDNCDKEWTQHWECLDQNNHLFHKCRSQETVFNDCIFQKMGLVKIIPETPQDEIPIHLKKNPLHH